MQRTYPTALGITVNGTAIPDPGKMSYQVGDLDTSGSRDATGLLHRAYVTTKINFEMSWNALEWEELQVILAAVNTPKFVLVAPDPRTFNTSYTGDYYVGDRTGDCLYYLSERPEKSSFNLKLKFIEY